MLLAAQRLPFAFAAHNHFRKSFEPSDFGLLCSGAADKRERMSRKSINALVVMMLALLCACSATLVAQEEKLAVTVVVLCEDAAAKKMIRESLLTHVSVP